MIGDPYLTEVIILQELPYLTLLMAFPGDKRKQLRAKAKRKLIDEK